MITVFQWRLLRWYPGSTAACAARSASASSGSHLRLTRSESAPSWERANILPATLNTEVLRPKGNVSSIPPREGPQTCARSILSSSRTATTSSAIVRMVHGRRGESDRPEPRLSIAITVYPCSRTRGTAISQTRAVIPRGATATKAGERLAAAPGLNRR
jgi:hypothetical protein